MPSLPWTPVEEFTCTGWADPADADARAHGYCEKLEAGQILFFSSLPFSFPEADREFLLTRPWSESHLPAPSTALRASLAGLHKNVSYRPSGDVLRGFFGKKPAQNRMLQVMRNYSAQVLEFLARFLSPYAGKWSVDYASFRPFEEEGRELPLHKRNDLLHVDAFPSRPTRGGRILRVFTNLNPHSPRVWLTADRFSELARQFAVDAGLEEIAAGGSFLRRQRARLGRAFRLPGASRSPYDRFMLRFHDYLKENAAFQSGCAKVRMEFPPMATWLAFTDGVPHAVLSGQFALEQTLLIAPSALVAPQHAPIRVLETLCGRPLAP